MRKNRLFSLELISQYRSGLMGFAIIWVIIYHLGLQMPFISKFSGFGFGGVDIFMFVSGFGLYFSLSRKDFHLLSFYKKRFIRIFPAFWIAYIFSGILIMNDNLSTYLWKCTTLGYWTNGLYYDWYIPAIVTLYLLFPFIYKLVYKRNALGKLIFIFIAFFMVLSILAINVSDKYCDNWHYLLLYRVPIFLYGTYIAYVLCTGKNSYFQYVSIISFVIGIILLICGRKLDSLRLVYFSVSFCIPLLIAVLCICFSRLNRINKIISWVGMISLEMYLVHIVFLKLNSNGDLLFLHDFPHDLKAFVILLITVLLSIGLKKLTDRLFVPKL